MKTAKSGGNLFMHPAGGPMRIPVHEIKPDTAIAGLPGIAAADDDAGLRSATCCVEGHQRCLPAKPVSIPGGEPAEVEWSPLTGDLGDRGPRRRRQKPNSCTIKPYVANELDRRLPKVASEVLFKSAAPHIANGRETNHRPVTGWIIPQEFSRLHQTSWKLIKEHRPFLLFTMYHGEKQSAAPEWAQNG